MADDFVNGEMSCGRGVKHNVEDDGSKGEGRDDTNADREDNDITGENPSVGLCDKVPTTTTSRKKCIDTGLIVIFPSKIVGQNLHLPLGSRRVWTPA